MTEGFAGKGWALAPQGSSLTLTTDAGVERLPDVVLDKLVVCRRRWRWHLLDGQSGESLLHLRGLNRRRANALTDRLETWGSERDEHRINLALLARVDPEVDAVHAWLARLTRASRDGEGHRRWITHDEVEELVRLRPTAPTLRELASRASGLLTPTQSTAVRALDADLQDERRRANELAEEELLDRHRTFFDAIESSPLTREQARAVICCDNRVQVIAAAGSGKTSVMVARAAYAIATGLTTADRILLLAFNKDAAAELQQRVETRLRTQEIPSGALRAATFHSFGLSLIGHATGAKPRLAPWLDDRDGAPMVGHIVDELRDKSPAFRYQWDLYRLVFARTADSPEGAPAEWWDRQTDVAGHRTLRGDTVRSQGEKMIADWLYLNGVAYDYERAYTHPVADSEHAQYRRTSTTPTSTSGTSTGRSGATVDRPATSWGTPKGWSGREACTPATPPPSSKPRGPTSSMASVSGRWRTIFARSASSWTGTLTDPLPERDRSSTRSWPGSCVPSWDT